MKVKIIILLVCFASVIQAQKLDSLLVWSANNHPDLKAAYLSYEASLQKVHGTGFLPEPVFSFGYFVSSPETRLGPQIASVGLQQMFPWKGTLKAKKSITVAQSKMEFEQFNLLKINLFRDVKKLYYEAQNKEENVKLLIENIVLLEQVKSVGLARVESGSGSTTDVLRLNLKVEEMKTKRSTENVHLKGFVEQLCLLTGKSPLKLIFENDFDDSIEQNEVTDFDSIVNHPMIAMSKEKLVMNNAQKRIIAQKALPKFGLGVNYVLVNKRTDMNPVGNGRDVLMPKLSMTLPIYRKRYKALSKMNQLENESIREEVKGVALDLNIKLVKVMTNIESAKERLVLYQKQTKTAQSILTILQSDYENNATSLESILTTQVQLVNYQMEMQHAMKNLRVAKSQLAFLLTKEL
ncbi:MAG: cobalt-zinc-cadmium efflux system outer membrane protein [Glaciecola sp.]|jgi:cobalt-zinc-cadmium efflux system outer membrane protein